MALITSPGNPHIKQVRALAQRKQRDTAGLCVAEGIFHTGEALASGDVAYLVYAPELLISPFGRELVSEAEARGTPAYPVTDSIMASIAGKENPQGLLAVVRQRHVQLEDLTSGSHPWLVALVSPQDPGNVGTILRTIDAVGASGLLLLDGGVDPYHPAAIRAGMGTIFHLPVVQTSFEAFAARVRGQGYHLYGTSARGQTEYRSHRAYVSPLVLLMGSEREGLSAAQTAACDHLLRLPMHGRAGSLNLAVATSVFLYAIHDSLAQQGFFGPAYSPES